MPPPSSASRRGPGRPSGRKSGDKNIFATEGKARASTTINANIKEAEIEDSSLAPSETVDQQTSPAVIKRKRGRPPKNRTKEMPTVIDSAFELDQNNTRSSGIQENKDSRGKIPEKYSSNINFDDTNDAKTVVRRSLPETSATIEMNDYGRSRRSLDSILSSRTKDDKFIAAKVASTRYSNSQRRKKSATSRLRFRARANSSASWTPPQQDIEGTFINHSVTIAPILPPVLIDNNDDNTSLTTTNENSGEQLQHDSDDRQKVSEPSTSRELQSKYPIVFDKGVPKASSCIAPPFSKNYQTSSGTSSSSSSKHKSSQSQHQQSQLPTWSPLYNPPVFFENDYDQETGQLDIDNTIPVTRHITAMSVRKPDNDYLVLGDSVGFVTIYSLANDNINLPIAQLESIACQQRGKPEQERLRADILKRKKQTKGSGKGSSGSKSSSLKNTHMPGLFPSNIGARPGTSSQMQPAFASGPQQMRSIVIDTSDTTIHALGMVENRVVLATSEELECMDVPSGTSLWVCPLSSNRFVVSLDMHLSTFDVLVSCSKEVDTAETVASPISPLMLLQHSENNVEICDANSPMLIRSQSCSAIWDVSARNRLLFIALSSNRQEHELVLVSGGSIDSWKVACKTKIPTKGSSATGVAAATKLSQSPGGKYTIVASSRGIRLYETESLQLIHVYGDQLALHGQSVIWKDCWLAGSFFSKNTNMTNTVKGLPSQLLQCEDWIGEKINGSGNKSNSRRTNNTREDEKTFDLAPYIIGVPHTKGPKELCEKLHVWKVEYPSVVPMMNIPLPHKAEGALGLVASSNRSISDNARIIEDRIVLVTTDGQGHLLLPKMESKFAGIAYPPGYQVVTDNIEYIEDEDVTDDVIVDSADANDICDDETEDADVDLLGREDDDESMDEDLREAMRQSLLEHKKHERALERDNVVDILDTEAKTDTQFLPCRPEPYLRQMINTHQDEDTPEKEVDEEGEANLECVAIEKISDRKRFGKDEATNIVETKPKLTDAIFVSKLLNCIPNMPKPKPMEEDCLSFTTTKVVVAVNPVLPQRQGRAKKTRTANLESMLKASINPYLQSLMISKQGVAVNGRGSRLREVRAKMKSSTSLDEIPDNLKTSNHTEKLNGESHSSCNSSIAALNTKRSQSPRQATNDDEAAVVMGLLGLSPCHATNEPTNTFVSPDSKEDEMGANSTNSQAKGSAYLTSSSLSVLGLENNDNQVISAVSSDRGSVVEGSENITESTIGKSKVGPIDNSCSACRGRLVIHSCGKRSLPIDYEELARIEKERKEKEEEEKKRIRAEKRRLADQKRREAKKQKQRELEEQRLREEEAERLELEKQQRLKQDFASQDLNRQRREQIVSSYANHLSMDMRNQTKTTNEPSSVAFARNHNREPTPLFQNGVRQKPLAQRIENGYNPGFKVSTSADESPQFRTDASVFERDSQLIQKPTLVAENKYLSNSLKDSWNPTVLNENRASNLSTSDKHVIHPKSPLVQAASPSVSGIDALFALADLAESTKTLPVTESNNSKCAEASNESEWSSHASSRNIALSGTTEPTVTQHTYPAFAPSHGFSTHHNSSDPASYCVSGEMKRGIPSYATIRGQFSHEASNNVATAMADKPAHTTSFSNGYTHQTDEAQVYSWPTRSDSHN